MSDWFGESPVETREILPYHFENWQSFCSFCGEESIIFYRGKYLCLRHAEELWLEWIE